MTIKELYNSAIYFKENWAILWNLENKQVYWRNTWTGQEKNIGIANSLAQAKELKNEFVEQAIDLGLAIV